jgi:mutator protein MutT
MAPEQSPPAGGNCTVKRIHVAAAVIRDDAGKILIARRADTQHQGGLWEFPGGKVEADESVETALARELHEELGIVVDAARPLIKVRHDYPDKQVLLDVWEVSAFTGQPHGAEGQPLAWVTPRDLANYEFPAANQPIVAAARLPKGLKPLPCCAACRRPSLAGSNCSSCVRPTVTTRNTVTWPWMQWGCVPARLN